MLRLLALAAAAGAAAGCAPTLDDRPWLITRTEIVGWKAEPPEVPPGGSVSLQIFALGPPGSPSGPPDPAGTSWTLCRTPKPPAENRVVAPDCLAPPAATAAGAPDAVGDPVAIKIPVDACRLFGPDAPQPPPGAPPTRPRDADASGGYYQPVAIALDAATAIGLQRITCDLPEASLADARAFQAAYHPNQNPTLAALTFSAAASGGAAPTPVDPGAVPRGAPVMMTATWLDGAAETFPIFDRRSRTVVETQETLSASWYVTGGTLDRPAALIAGAATETTVTTTWTAPDAPGAYDLVLVLRDSRGGSDVARVTLVVPGG